MCSDHSALYTNVRNVHCTEYTMYGMYNVRNVQCTECTMYGMYNVRNVQCTECTIYGIFTFLYVNDSLHR